MKTMSELYDSIRLTRSAATFTRALGIDAPDGADAPCDIVLDKLFAELGEGGADRVFIYNPDAIALWLFQKYTELFKDAILRTQIQLPMLSVMPSVAGLLRFDVFGRYAGDSRHNEIRKAGFKNSDGF